jgi:hypothetical protein
MVAPRHLIGLESQMADDPNRNRFIPFRKADIVSMCCNDSRMDAGDAQEFREFCRILEALFHLSNFFTTFPRQTLKCCFPTAGADDTI